MDVGPAGSPVSLHEPGSDAVRQGGDPQHRPLGHGVRSAPKEGRSPSTLNAECGSGPSVTGFLGENMLVKIKCLLMCFHCYSTQGELRLLAQIVWIHMWVAVARAGMGWMLAMSRRMKASSQSCAGKPHGLMGSVPSEPRADIREDVTLLQPHFQNCVWCQEIQTGRRQKSQNGITSSLRPQSCMCFVPGELGLMGFL